jgi:hypothetical protein
MMKMKKILMAFGAIILCGLVILFFQGREVREIKTEVQIAAPTEQVWKTLTTFNDWKDWNPTIILAQGDASVGSKLNITINGNGKEDSNYQPTVLESSAPLRFRWRANMITDVIFRNDRVFILEAKDGGTHLIHKEEFSGMMVPLMWGMFQDFVGPTLEKMNKALKHKMEP